jgi:hypothetical protein
MYRGRDDGEIIYRGGNLLEKTVNNRRRKWI